MRMAKLEYIAVYFVESTMKAVNSEPDIFHSRVATTAPYNAELNRTFVFGISRYIRVNDAAVRKQRKFEIRW